MSAPSPPRRESLGRTLGVAATVCLICSVLVTGAHQLLEPRQRANRERARERQVLEIIAAQPALADVLATLDDAEVRARVVELDTGLYADWIDPAQYDREAAAQDPLQSIELERGQDLADIGRRANLATVYEVRRGGVLQLVILPVHGSGYGGPMHGHLAVSADGSTVVGLRFHEHAETPGLGGEIESEEWLARWVGKRLRDDEGRVRIGTTQAPVDPTDPHRVDGITGATVTSDAVTRLLRFWVGELGFGPYLRRIAS